MTVDLFSFPEFQFTFMSRVYERADYLLKSLERETWHERHRFAVVDVVNHLSAFSETVVVDSACVGSLHHHV